MEYRRVAGGRVLRRRSFIVLSAVAVLLFGGGAFLPAWAALSGDDPGAMFGAAMCLGVGSLAYRAMRSRIHLTETSIVVVNPLMTYRIPYDAVRKAEVNQGGSLIIVPRVHDRGAEDEEGYFVVGFAGSLLDRAFNTSAKAAAEINKVQRRRRKSVESGGKVTRSLTADLVAEMFLASAAICAVYSLFLRS
ncbi:hypothetical protein [Streptomyces bacillaris]|uniref:hypothetical protein n=1 Tax=Streptomyces bacillaris TaxID=68179 RepID=UPI0013A6A6D4